MSTRPVGLHSALPRGDPKLLELQIPQIARGVMGVVLRVQHLGHSSH